MLTVTGGSGFIGTNLCRYLAERGDTPWNVDIKGPHQFHQDHALVDICDLEALSGSLKGDTIVHLAAEHRDDVRPLSKYQTVNVDGTRNVARAAEANGISRIVFTSSVAVYGFAPADTDESGAINPFNEYGRTKFEAENALRDWYAADPDNRSLTIVRPTVVFGPGNRGNVFNLLDSIARQRFVMIGDGENRKSMAFIDNIVGFLAKATTFPAGLRVFNYIDKPDLNMNELVSLVRQRLHGKSGVGPRLPMPVGRVLGAAADVAARISGRNLPVSSVRIKKFASTTTFSSAAHDVEGFAARYSLSEGLERTLQSEFIAPEPSAPVFYTE